MKEIEMYKYARKPLEMNTKPGDKVLILADTNTEPAVWQVLMANACQMDLEPTLAIITPREFHHADPPSTAAAAMQKADLTLLCTSKGMIHSPVVGREMEAGRKFVAMEEITSDMLIRGGCQEDYPKMIETAYKVRKLLTEGRRIRVTSELGTDITANIEGRPGYICAGRAEKQPNIFLFCAAFPDGEAGIAPIEGTGEGVVVFDTAMHFLGKVRSPLTVKVSKGKAIGFSGEQAGELEEVLKKFGDQYSYNFPAEISVGLNSKVILTGSVRTDKKLYGSAHIAFGMNADVGGLTPGKIHLDGVIRYPDVVVDDKVIVSKGHLSIT